jgi:hypothetical protein
MCASSASGRPGLVLRELQLDTVDRRGIQVPDDEIQMMDALDHGSCSAGLPPA